VRKNNDVGFVFFPGGKKETVTREEKQKVTNSCMDLKLVTRNSLFLILFNHEYKTNYIFNNFVKKFNKNEGIFMQIFAILASTLVDRWAIS